MNSSQDHWFATSFPQTRSSNVTAQTLHCSERQFPAVSDLFILLYSSHVDLSLPGALCGYLLMFIFPTLKCKLSVLRDLPVLVLFSAIRRTVPGNVTEAP